MAEKVGGVFYEVDLDTSKMIRSQREVDRRLDDMGKSGDRLQTKFTAVAAGITAAIAAIGVEALASKLVTAQRNFDVLFSSLKTVTGGADAAGAAFERLRLFAAQTPYTLDQAVNGFVKLKALGLDPSERAMTSFGNTASAMGKSLSQMIEAVADASTGEFERLKEFGIKARTEGDKIIFTFRGVSTEVQNSANKITEYLTKIGETDFAGAMSERMKTLDGDLSNLEDSWAEFVLTVSQSGLGDQIAASVRMASEAIQEMTVSVKQGGLTDYFSTLQAIMPVLEVAVVSLAGAMAGRMVAALAAAATQAYATAAAMGAATVAARGFGAALTLMGGPIGVAITALALIALNWDKISNRAKSAAEVTEDAADRIAKALQRSAGNQTAALKGTKSELQSELGAAKQGLTNLKVGTYGKGTPQQIAEAEARVLALQAAVAKIDAMLGTKNGENGLTLGGVSGGAGRGFVNPDPVVPDPASGDNKDKKTTRQPFDSAGYLAGLEAQTADAWARVGIIEQESLRKNDELLKKKDISTAQHAQAIRLIEEKAAQDRQQILFDDITARLEIIAQAGEKETEARTRARELMDSILKEAMSPAERLRLEEAEKLIALEAALDADLSLRGKYELSKQALRESTAAKLKEIEDKELEAEQAARLKSVSIMSDSFGMLYSMMSQSGKKRTALAKTLFAAQKALAVAEILLNTEIAASKAGAQLGVFGIPMATLIRAQGYASAGMVAGLAIGELAGGRQYGGPVSAGSMYRVNETGKSEMFQGSAGQQYFIPGSNGKIVPAGQAAAGGGAAVNFSVNVHNNNGSAVTTQRNGNSVDVFINEAANQIRARSGPLWNAFKTTNVQGRLD